MQAGSPADRWSVPPQVRRPSVLHCKTLPQAEFTSAEDVKTETGSPADRWSVGAQSGKALPGVVCLLDK